MVKIPKWGCSVMLAAKAAIALAAKPAAPGQRVAAEAGPDDQQRLAVFPWTDDDHRDSSRGQVDRCWLGD